MRNLRQLRSAFALSMFIGAAMLASSPTLHAGGPSDKSVSVRCALLARAIKATTATLGADSSVVARLQAEYNAFCTAAD
jgi:hypothetical protein